MLNSSANNNVSVSAVSGSLQKSHPKSYFQAFHINSHMANDNYFGQDTNLVILQVMNTHDGWIIVEAVKKIDYP